MGKEQCVAAFSRTQTTDKIIIVGQKKWAINKIWELITIINQWTQMMENVLDTVTINSDTNSERSPT